MTQKSPQIKILLLLVLIIAIGVLFSLLKSSRVSLPGPGVTNLSATPVAKTQEARSGDGKMQLTMEVANSTVSGSTYSFFITESSIESSKRLLFTRTVTAGETFSLPANSWSPDGKYIFIEEQTASARTFLVFKATGEAFANGEKYLDVGKRFAESNLKYTLKDATGWASETLLIVTTTKDGGDKGPSFWFEVTSQNFLQLRS